MNKISESVRRKDHESKINGSAIYVDDCFIKGMLLGISTKPKKKRMRFSARPLQVVAIREACQKLQTYDLSGCTIYATGEKYTKLKLRHRQNYF